MMQHIFQVDAFTSQPFTGNPAGVCPLTAAPSAIWMQAVADEMNCAETAFIWPEGAAWRLRWFTPAVEVDLCGHATLSAAHIAWSEGLAPKDKPISFLTRSGALVATPGPEGVALDFPAKPAKASAMPEGLLAALALAPAQVNDVGRSVFDVLIEVADETTLRAIEPNILALKTVQARGVIVTAAADARRDYDFVSRFFAPLVGVDEDHVTGSAHCTLAPHWHQRLKRDTLIGYQASRRGGYVRLRHAGERVFLTGKAVTVIRGELVPKLAV